MNFREAFVGNGNVVLIAGGGKIYTDVAARFVKSERDLKDIVATPYSQNLVRTILSSGHMAALEFDWFLFGVEGYSRVCETQLVRKRHASYMIKSGRTELGGQREFSVVLPQSVADFGCWVRFASRQEQTTVTCRDLLSMLADFYDQGVRAGIPEEDLRYMKPQATEFKALVGMNAHALRDWFAIRCCNRAQAEIRDMANKMLRLCREATPDLFEGAGPNCRVLGYCPENDRQCSEMKGRVPTKEEAFKFLKGWSRQ